jgi:malonyl CoA-acyl carrier protein transacylase
MELEKIGPGKVLTGLIGRIKKDAGPLVIKDEKLVGGAV